MSKAITLLIVLLLIGLGVIGGIPLESAPLVDLADEDLTKSILYEGGYIPHLELDGNTLVVSAVDTIRVFDLSQDPIQETQTYRPANNRVTALNPSGDWIAFNLPGADGEGFWVSPLSELTAGHAYEGYALRVGIRRVNDLLLDDDLMSYAAVDTGDIWFAQDSDNPIIVQAHAGGGNNSESVISRAVSQWWVRWDSQAMERAKYLGNHFCWSGCGTGELVTRWQHIGDTIGGWDNCTVANQYSYGFSCHSNDIGLVTGWKSTCLGTSIG